MFYSVNEAVAAYRAANEVSETLDSRRDGQAWIAQHERRHVAIDYLRARGRTDLLLPLAMEQATITRPDEHAARVASTDALLTEHAPIAHGQALEQLPAD